MWLCYKLNDEKTQIVNKIRYNTKEKNYQNYFIENVYMKKDQNILWKYSLELVFQILEVNYDIYYKCSS